MNLGSYEIFERKVVIRIKNRICENAEDLLASRLFKDMIKRAVGELQKRGSVLLKVFGKSEVEKEDIQLLIQTFQFLAKMPGEHVPNVVKGSHVFFQDTHLFNSFVEHLYNYWRTYDRFIICDSTGDDLDKRPYRTFNDTVENLTQLIRSVYRDICENITNHSLRIYRQVKAGAEIATISIPVNVPFPPTGPYKQLNQVLMIRQILLNPPLILNPPSNKRTGRFEIVHKNPMGLFDVQPEEWLCYPARVGSLVILIYFHKKYFELGFSLCNLFEVADDEALKEKPDAIFAFGAPPKSLEDFGKFPTVIYDDEKNDLLIGAVPEDQEFGYFGYLKKMVLTLHNIKMMKKGRLPFHGALVKIMLKGRGEATILMAGDTGAGKSETLEALRVFGENEIQDLIIIADDMGSLEINDRGEIIGYGTETGAFLRLDDLRPGYALGQIDRAIIMSPGKVNARIVLPVTTFENVIKGHRVHVILYANNYEEIDDEHLVIESFASPEQAMAVFREGTVMSKGTTTSTGLVHSYYGNIFGPAQCKELHEPLAQRFFTKFFENKLFVGQLRTRLGIAGMEVKGPEEAARELLKKLASVAENK
ncbi:MAG: phosphoenolpyruvate carboxykinase [Candidatus Omnitrophica bacterium]|nr:phosphoenolpyruvate carboxykinase [Candidatus Omnitrophota bacterium]MDD5670367.1 phosphoenolpyruvate carboxykinase [Candidatus Omnitrophota bacterium]